MYNIKNRVFSALLLLVALVVCPHRMFAQQNSINTYSPYTMYGIGEIYTPGSLPARSMGGAGVAQRVPSSINLLNPASYSVSLQRSVLFNFGLEGQSYYLSQPKSDGSTSRTSYNTFNIHDIALQIPLTKGLGLGINLNPYSGVGYRLYDRETVADVGTIEYDYEGEGDVTEVKLGVGWELFKGFSIGAAAQYYWGKIDRDFTMTIIPYTGDGLSTYPSTIGLSQYKISRVKGQVGVQYTPIRDRKRVLTIGATYDFGGALKPRVRNEIYVNGAIQSTAKLDSTSLSIVLPRQVVAGVYYETPKFAVAVDYQYQNWGSSNDITETSAAGFDVAYTNTSTIKAGVEWTPNRNDVRKFYRRWHYRAGFNYGNYHQTFDNEKINQYAVTLGVGIPVKFGGFSSIDVGFEYGCRGAETIIKNNVGLIKQQYFKFAVAFSLFGEDYWFVRPKFD